MSLSGFGNWWVGIRVLLVCAMEREAAHSIYSISAMLITGGRHHTVYTGGGVAG